MRPPASPLKNSPLSDLQETIEFVTERVSFQPRIALVLGSGLGGFADSLLDRQSIPSEDIPHYPRSTVEGHRGALVFGRVGKNNVIALQGRVHLYESGSVETVAYPLQIAQALGAQVLVVTNAAGAINRKFSAGDLMLISDQINMTGKTLRRAGPNERGGRILYDVELLELARRVGKELGLVVRSGVYSGVMGPSYETAAEVQMLGWAGADAVGMSTVLEVELASSLQMKVLGISCITNLATGIGGQKLSHAEVTVVANKVKNDFARLLSSILSQI